MGKQSQPSTQTTIQKTELPPWMSQGGEENYNMAKDVSANLMAPYQGNTVAGFNDTQKQAWDQIAGASQLAQPGMQTAANTLADAQHYNPNQVQAGSVTAGTVSPNSFLSGNVGAYMDPNLKAELAPALQAMDQQRQQALNGVSDSAIANHAAFGSRHGVMEGVTNAQSALGAGQLAASVYGDAYKNASGLLAQDNANNLQGQLANQSAGLQAGTTNLNANLQSQLANQQAGLTANQQAITGAATGAQVAGAQQMAGLQGAAALSSVGDQQQQYQQNLLNQQQQQYNAQRQQPIDQLNVRLQALGMTPHDSTTTTTGPSNIQSGNGLMQGLGLGMQGLGLLGSFGMFSDRNAKTDIEKLGKDPKTGLDLYAYRYKGDPKSYPKVVGPMAQDVEKKAPGSTQRVNGHLTIKRSFLSKVAA